MPVVAIIGLQWGDEGKGKVVDLYAEKADMVVRYGGGANAGHTLKVGGDKVVLHLLPSGVLHPHVTAVLTQGMVLDLATLRDELRTLETRGLSTQGRVFVSPRAHVVLPHHKAIDTAREALPGAIGTTKRGIGPAYEDKVGRRGVRVGDLFAPELLRERLEANLRHWAPSAAALDVSLASVDTLMSSLSEHAEALKPYVADAEAMVREAWRAKRHVLLEGAQGALLDVDDGTYPFVTSSHVSAAASPAYAGLPPKAIDKVIGVTKAYCTRVGEGPFPTEARGEAADALRARGEEFGATTGRPRRCGWLDLGELRRVCERNGVDELALTKLDVLDGFEQVFLAQGAEATSLSAFEGWSSGVSSAKRGDALPEAAKTLVKAIEEGAAAPVGLLSVGAERTATLGRWDCFDPKPPTSVLSDPC